MRLFIAINFNSETRLGLLALRDELRSRSERGNFVKPDNLHLTLAFLGECDAARTRAAKSVMDTISFTPFEISIERLGCFRRESGDVWWAGLSESGQLSALQGELTDKLIAAGFSLDRRRYSPHVTLGREVVTGAAPRQIEPFAETVRAIDLMKSERIDKKLVYTSIHSVGAATE